MSAFERALAEDRGANDSGAAKSGAKLSTADLREKLETTGQLGKMRAMIVDACVQLLTSNAGPGGGAGPQLFYPTEELTQARSSEEGQLALSVVADYLEYLGLRYTASVFLSESGLGDGRVDSGAVASALGTHGSSALPSLIQQRRSGSAGLLGAPIWKKPPPPQEEPRKMSVPTVESNAATAAKPAGRENVDSEGGESTAENTGAGKEASSSSAPASDKYVTDEETDHGAQDAEEEEEEEEDDSFEKESGADEKKDESDSDGADADEESESNKALDGDEAASSSDEESAKDDAAAPPSEPPGEDTPYFISKWTKRTFMRKGQVAGQQVQLEYLNDCTVIVLDPLDSMTVDDCEGGELVIAACEGSVFLRNCKNMTVHVACKQLRTRDCEGVALHIFTTTDPVVEMSHHISFYPFHLRLPGLKKCFADCRLDPKTNRFVHVYDFTRDAPNLSQPHFTVHFPDHGMSMQNRCGDVGVPECPLEIEDLLALRLMPAPSSESGTNKSYDIKTGAHVWASGGAGDAAPGAPVGRKPSTDSEKEEKSSEDVAAAPREQAPSQGLPKATALVPTAAAALASAGRPPVAVAPTKNAFALPATPGGLDDEEYSSFDEESVEDNEDDKYEVDEDDDDF